MNQFSLLPDAAKRLRKAALVKLLATLSFFIVSIVMLTMIDTSPLNLTFRDSSSYIVPVGTLFVFYFLDLIKANRTASSYRLTISDETITREVDKATVLSIPVREVRYITRWGNGSYAISGNDMLKPIVIPEGIERAEQLEALLTSLTNVTIKSQNFMWYKVFAISVLLFIAMIGAAFAANKYLATVLGLLVVGTMIYCWSGIQRSKDYDRKMRLLSHLIFIPLIALAVRIIWHWAA